MILVWLSPLILFLGLILSGRSALTAGVLGTLCVALVAWLAGPAHPDAAAIARHFAAGAWIGLPATLVIVAGLAFSLSLEKPSDAADAGKPEHGALAEACLLRGPFLETSTGFGVGYVVAVSGARYASGSITSWIAGSTLSGSSSSLYRRTSKCRCGPVERPVLPA